MPMTPDQLTLLFKQMHPDVDINTPEGNAALQGFVANGGDGGSNPFSPTGSNIQNAADNALLSGAQKAAAGGNTYQVQGGNQQGQFATQGQEAQSQVGMQAQQGTTTGQQTQDTTGTSRTTGTTSTTGQHGVVDTLGFGQLLKGGEGAAAEADKTRGGFLSDLVDTGGAGFNDQVDAAVRSSLSGPGMQGVGDSAKARAAGYATEAVARNNLNERLNATQQLAGPTAQQTLAASGNPYLGSTDSNTAVQDSTTQGTTHTTGNTTQQQNTFGTTLANSLTNQSQAGASSANNTQIAAGNQPEQGTTKSGGGGSVICSALAGRGMLPEAWVDAETAYIYANYEKFARAARGYYLWANRVAQWVKKNALVAWLCWPVAYGCSYEATRRSETLEAVKKRKLTCTLIYHVTFQLCDFIGRFIKPQVEVP